MTPLPTITLGRVWTGIKSRLNVSFLLGNFFWNQKNKLVRLLHTTRLPLPKACQINCKTVVSQKITLQFESKIGSLNAFKCNH